MKRATYFWPVLAVVAYVLFMTGGPLVTAVRAQLAVGQGAGLAANSGGGTACATASPTPTPLPGLVGTNIQTSSSITTMTFTVPPQAVANQVAIVMTQSEGTPSPAPPAGWTSLVAKANNTVQGQAWYKVLGAGDVGGNTEAFGSFGGNQAGGILAVFNNINHTTPLDGTFSFATSETASAITTNFANDAVILLSSCDNNGNYFAPSTMAELGSYVTSAGAEGGGDGFLVQAAAGTTGTFSARGTTGQLHCVAALVALAQGS